MQHLSIPVRAKYCHITACCVFSKQAARATANDKG